jgi:hypothetical protein
MFPELPEVTLSDSDEVKLYIESLPNYTLKRIGFRTEMTTAWQILNDRLFHKPPAGDYGKDGYIFDMPPFNPEDGDIEDIVIPYVDYIKQMEKYCESRGAYFLYVINPTKESIYSEMLPDSVKYRFPLRNRLTGELERQDIDYIDLTKPLRKAAASGIQVTNIKFDSGHWNQNGAYYGVSSILDRIGESVTHSAIHSLDISAYDVTQVNEPYLISTRFPINEKMSDWRLKYATAKQIDDYGEQIHFGDNWIKHYSHFVNDDQSATSNLLMFCGSHIWGYQGGQFSMNTIANQFSESRFISSYDTIQSLPYYFNLFHPDVVVYETAERTISPTHINLSAIKQMVLSPPGTDFFSLPKAQEWELTATDIPYILKEDASHCISDISVTVHGAQVGNAYLKIKDNLFDVTKHSETVAVGGNENVAEFDTALSFSLTGADLFRVRAETVELLLVNEDASGMQRIKIGD